MILKYLEPPSKIAADLILVYLYYIYIYIYSTIYRHVFRCSANQCSLVQSGYGMAVTTACGTIAVMRTSRVLKLPRG